MSPNSRQANAHRSRNKHGQAPGPPLIPDKSRLGFAIVRRVLW